MSSVPVTRRKMMKMLMILSSDRSNHTIIYSANMERTTETGSRREEGGKMEVAEQIQSQCCSEGFNIQWLKRKTWRNLCPFECKGCLFGPEDIKVVGLVSQQWGCLYTCSTHPSLPIRTEACKWKAQAVCYCMHDLSVYQYILFWKYCVRGPLHFPYSKYTSSFC